MKIKFLGCGNMSSVKYRNTQALLEIKDGNNLLIDCGSDSKFNFALTQTNIAKVKNIILTHAHGDHVGGLEYLGFMTYFNPFYEGKPNIYANYRVLKDLWAKTLSGGMESLEKRQLKNGETEATLRTYFEPHFIKDNGSFSISGITFIPVQTIHIVSGTSFMDTYGLLFTTDTGKKVFFTGDTQYSPSQLAGILEDSDIIFHDCETGNYASGVHAHYNELKNLPIEYKKKIRLMHFGDDVDDAYRKKAKDDGFWGFVDNNIEYEI